MPYYLKKNKRIQLTQCFFLLKKVEKVKITGVFDISTHNYDILKSECKFLSSN